MIVEKILHNAQLFPKKEAISYKGETILYGQLAEAIQKRNNVAEKFCLIKNENPIESLVSLLGLSRVGTPFIVAPKDFNEMELEIDNFREKERTAFGILSSGSSGKPKVIWKTNDNWEKAFEHQSNVFGIDKNDRVFVLDALSYSANLNAALHILWAGGTLVLGELKNAKNWEKQFLEDEVSSCFLVPSHCNLILKNDTVNNAVNSIVTAGEKLSFDAAKKLLLKFPKALLTEYYGAAELGHITYHQNQDIIDFPNSVGKPFPKVRVSINEEKVNVKSQYISQEYKNIATVNDLGYFEQNRLILKGRAGRVFNKRALNIYAQEIENLAISFSPIQKAILVKDEVTERLNLYFTSKNQFDKQNEIALAKFLREHLPASKLPHFVKELKEIPHSEAGKVDFRALSKMSNEDKKLRQTI